MPRLSIVVLPFLNLSGNHEQQYFADAIVDDLTTDLSRITGMLVISRNTAFTYRNKNLDTKQIGRELEVRYVLEGSVRQLGKQARVTAQLIDAEADTHLWADRFDRTMDDLFILQDEITRRIAVALGVELIAAEAARPTDHLDALDYTLRGRAVLLKPGTPDTYREAINLFEHALALDPRSAEAQSLLASALAGRALDQMTDTFAGDIARAEGLVGAALVASPRSTRAHFAKGLVLRAQNRFEDAIPEFETVVASSRNWVNALALLGQCKLLLGSFDEAIELQEKAIRLSPRDPLMAAFYWRIGLVHLLKSHTDEAIVWFEKALRASPKHPLPHAYLAAAYGLRGDISRAAAELLEARKFGHDKRYSSIASLKALGSFRLATIYSLAENTYFAGLRKAGVPEE